MAEIDFTIVDKIRDLRKKIRDLEEEISPLRMVRDNAKEDLKAIKQDQPLIYGLLQEGLFRGVRDYPD